MTIWSKAGCVCLFSENNTTPVVSRSRRLSGCMSVAAKPSPIASSRSLAKSVSVRTPVPSPWTIIPAGLSMAMSQASQ